MPLVKYLEKTETTHNSITCNELCFYKIKNTDYLCVCVCVCVHTRVLPGFELRAYTLSHSPALFCEGFF
jgi:hypothetical protein